MPQPHEKVCVTTLNIQSYEPLGLHPPTCLSSIEPAYYACAWSFCFANSEVHVYSVHCRSGRAEIKSRSPPLYNESANHSAKNKFSACMILFQSRTSSIASTECYCCPFRATKERSHPLNKRRCDNRMAGVKVGMPVPAPHTVVGITVTASCGRRRGRQSIISCPHVSPMQLRTKTELTLDT